jgi:hypothetical protein
MTKGLLLVLCLWAASSTAAAERVRFNDQIRPLLSDRCNACHGPDEKRREADLRLDTRAGAIGDPQGTHAIIPGRPDDSPLWQRITSTDPDVQMPPPTAKKPRFTAAELALIRRWIEEGAEYEGHWAFLPLRTDLPPTMSGAQNPVDAFIRAKLAETGIAPSPAADRATLIRRLTLDLSGVLPKPEEVADFLADDHPAATERLIDRLMASPQYGERWGRHWLDQARYADSNGYAIDAPREMWPYRDWVIDAINRDLPFDQFTVEQLAGDLLDSPTKSQLVATGFHRNTLINQEGGTDKEQFRVEAAMDRVNTTGAVWLGLTVGCAQCHTHKFDPLTHREYYRLFAFFNAAQDANDRGPVVDVVRGEMFGRPVDLAKEPQPPSAAELKKLRQAWEASTRKQLQATVHNGSRPTVWTPLSITSARTESGAPLETLKDGSLLGTPKSSANERYTITANTSLPSVAAIRLRVLTHDSLPKRGPGLASNGNFVLTRFQLRSGGNDRSFQRATADHEQPDFAADGAIDADPKSGWAINVGPGSTAKMNTDHEAVFALAEPLLATDQPLEFVLSHELNANYLIGRFVLEATAELRAAPSSDAALLAALEKPDKDRTDAERTQLQTAFEKAEPKAKPPTKKAANPDLVQAMVMRDLPAGRETYLLTRGDFTRPDKELGPLSPGVFAAIVPPVADAKNRLDLAKWLVHPDHPLTSRVTVNRMWMRYFGRGLVETDEDFGAQGAPPTHPALLDWLSREFHRREWSQKGLQRQIVSSAAYQQSSRHRPELADKDARNLLLSRQERFRLEAEVVRDAALSASGLLDRTLGGPSVYPPQPDGVYAFTQVNKVWPTDAGRNRFRRGLYTFFFRSAPYPLFTTFDAPDFQAVCTRRLRSNTPLQALTLANDPAFFELARGLAQRLAAEVPGEFVSTLDARIRLGAVLCWSRVPTSAEAAVLRRFVELERMALEQDPVAATALTSDTLRQSVSDPDAAGLVLLARTLFNADNFISRE